MTILYNIMYLHIMVFTKLALNRYLRYKIQTHFTNAYGWTASIRIERRRRVTKWINMRFCTRFVYNCLSAMSIGMLQHLIAVAPIRPVILSISSEAHTSKHQTIKWKNTVVASKHPWTRCTQAVSKPTKGIAQQPRRDSKTWIIQIGACIS